MRRYTDYLMILALVSACVPQEAEPEPETAPPPAECRALCSDICEGDQVCVSDCQSAPCDDGTAVQCRALCSTDGLLDVGCVGRCMVELQGP